METGNTTPIEYPKFPGTEKDSAEIIVARQRAQIDKRLWTKFQTWLGMLLYVILVALICSHSDVSTAYRQNEHILNTLKTVYTVSTLLLDWHHCTKSLKIPKGYSESVYRRTDNTMAKRKSTK
jgi:hypothetical protein